MAESKVGRKQAKAEKRQEDLRKIVREFLERARRVLPDGPATSSVWTVLRRTVIPYAHAVHQMAVLRDRVYKIVGAAVLLPGIAFPVALLFRPDASSNWTNDTVHQVAGFGAFALWAFVAFQLSNSNSALRRWGFERGRGVALVVLCVLGFAAQPSLWGHVWNGLDNPAGRGISAGLFAASSYMVFVAIVAFIVVQVQSHMERDIAAQQPMAQLIWSLARALHATDAPPPDTGTGDLPFSANAYNITIRGAFIEMEGANEVYRAERDRSPDALSRWRVSIADSKRAIEDVILTSPQNVPYAVPNQDVELALRNLINFPEVSDLSESDWSEAIQRAKDVYEEAGEKYLLPSSYEDEIAFNFRQPATRREIADSLEASAKALEAMPLQLPAGDAVNGAWSVRAYAERAAAVRQLKQWVLLPLGATRSELSAKLRDLLKKVATGDLGGLEQREVPSLPKAVWQATAVQWVMPLVIVALPATVVFGMRALNLKVPAIIDEWWLPTALLVGALKMLFLLDPEIGTQIEKTKGVIDLFRGKGGAKS